MAEPVTIAALYGFFPLADPAGERGRLLPLLQQHGVKGTLILAPEGVNGTIAGPADGVQTIVAAIGALAGGARLEVKYATAPAPPFARGKVRVKREIVTMGRPEVDAAGLAGTYVAPQEWNALIADPDVLLIDTRNDYEVAIGSFTGAVDPKLQQFRDFPAWFDAQAAALAAAGRTPKIAMFCTGGIRCEKATAYARARGFEQVYHLEGGILRYLEEVPADASRWQGDCFVFDERVAVGHGLAPGRHAMCADCGWPVADGAAHVCGGEL